MNIRLEPHQEQAIQAAIAAGRFRSLEEFIESAVRTLAPSTASPSHVGGEAGPAMVQIGGLWVHQGRPEPGANWDRPVEDVREERLVDILKASQP